MKIKQYIKEIIFVCIVVLSIGCMVFHPIAELSKVGNGVLGITIITIAGWIIRPWNIPFAVSGVFFMGMVLIYGITPTIAFSGFVQSALWTLIPALFFGYVLQKTGLGKRIAMGIFGLLPVSWLSLIIAWAAIGIALSLVTPSMTVRVSIMFPIALECCELYQLKRGSVSSSYILIYSIMMALVPGNGWLTGGLLGPIIQGIFGTIPELASVVTFDSWLRAAFVPVISCTVLLVVLLFFFLRPTEKLPSQIVLSKQRKITKEEIMAAIILMICCIMFFTGSYHGISNTTICLMALVLFFVLKVLDPEDFTKGINWDLIFFIGSALSMSGIFLESGISDWLSNLILGVFVRFSAYPGVFILLLMTVLFVWRFIDVTTLLPTMVILAPVIVKVTAQSSINPMVWAVIFALVTCSMFLSYTNMWTCMGKQMAKDYVWKESHMFRAGVAYYFACIGAMLIAIPYWMNIGMI